jgi:hypothetical protein
MPSKMSIHHIEGIISRKYTGMRYTHCWRHYQEEVYWYELCSLLKALTGRCILVWCILIFEGIIRRMYTGMSYAHCWRHYQEEVYWYELHPFLKRLSGVGILAWVMFNVQGINRVPSKISITNASIPTPDNAINNEHSSYQYTSSW